MFLALNAFTDRQTGPTSLRGHEQGDLPVDDPPPMDHPSDNYGAWQATAIFELKPFSTPSR